MSSREMFHTTLLGSIKQQKQQQPPRNHHWKNTKRNNTVMSTFLPYLINDFRDFKKGHVYRVDSNVSNQSRWIFRDMEIPREPGTGKFSSFGDELKAGQLNADQSFTVVSDPITISAPHRFEGHGMSQETLVCVQILTDTCELGWIRTYFKTPMLFDSNNEYIERMWFERMT
jgi:hypothetical protein